MRRMLADPARVPDHRMVSGSVPGARLAGLVRWPLGAWHAAARAPHAMLARVRGLSDRAGRLITADLLTRHR